MALHVFAAVVALGWVGCIESARPRFVEDADTGMQDTVETGDDVVGDDASAEADSVGPKECFNDGDCVPPDDPCQKKVCDENRCVLQDRSEGAACDDGDKCTGDGQCHEHRCDKGSPVVDGTTCDEDELVCNGSPTCTDGQCDIALPPTCAASNNPCAKGAECSEVEGGCVDIPVDDGKSCDGPAGALDAKSWQCSAGVCVPPDMVGVPRGTFTMGCQPNFCAEDNGPAHEVRVSAFAIDRLEASEKDFRDCRDDVAGRGFACPARADEDESEVLDDPDDMPARWIDWARAEALCAYRGKRLCTEAEWEYAARGDSDAFFPWGNLGASCARATYFAQGGPGCGLGKPSAVGAKPTGASTFGALDMAGNVAEWCADYYNPVIYTQRAGTTPLDPVQSEVYETESHVVRGGSFRDGIQGIRVFDRAAEGSEVYSDDIGVRCCLSLTGP